MLSHFATECLLRLSRFNDDSCTLSEVCSFTFDDGFRPTAVSSFEWQLEVLNWPPNDDPTLGPDGLLQSLQIDSVFVPATVPRVNIQFLLDRIQLHLLCDDKYAAIVSSATEETSCEVLQLTLLRNKLEFNIGRDQMVTAAGCFVFVLLLLLFFFFSPPSLHITAMLV
jgi:hypothetical protein